MGILAILGFVLGILLQIYVFILWARFVLDWVRVLNPRFRPRGVWLALVEAVYTVTDPPIRMFQKILPPIRLGAVALDLGWMLTMLSCWILLAILPLILH